MCRGLSQRWLDNAVRRCRCRTRGRIQPTYWKAWPLAAFCDRQSKLEDSVRRQVATFANSRSSPTTEGFYDTASHRSQQTWQHQTVYQKDTTLLERRCPRHGKPKHVTEADDMANRTMLQRRSRGLAQQPCCRTLNHRECLCQVRTTSGMVSTHLPGGITK